MTVSSYVGSREPSVVPAFAWLLAALAGFTYASWVLQFAVNPGLDPVNGYVSELSASDQPYHYLFAAGDLASGLLVIAMVAVVIRSLRPRGHALAGWLALVMFGAFSIADSAFAMDCAPNSDTTCALRERAGKVSFAHQFHSVTSTCVVMAGIISLIALTIASRRGHGRNPLGERSPGRHGPGGLPVIARWSWPLLVVETVTAAATLPLMYLGMFLGVMERIQVAMISIWLFVIAAQLYAGRRRPRRRGEPGASHGPGISSTWLGPPRARPERTARGPEGHTDDGTWEEAARR